MMSKARNSSVLTLARPQPPSINKGDVSTLRYQMKKPLIPIYPMEDVEFEGKEDKKDEDLTYPDYRPWRDGGHHTSEELEKLDNAMYLNKGYLEPSYVGNESHSAKSLMQATLFNNSNNCNSILQELSKHLTGAHDARNDRINKVKPDSKGFRIPQRVTLTSAKREQWFKDLADPSIPLSKVALKIPYGIRNKTLLDALCSKKVPIPRAIWFTKCVLVGEFVSVKKKQILKFSMQSPMSTNLDPALSERIEEQWYYEWTQQLVDYIQKLHKDMTTVSTSEKKRSYVSKFHYVIAYIQSLFVESLFDKMIFLGSIIDSLKNDLPLEPWRIKVLWSELNMQQSSSYLKGLELNLAQRLILLTFIRSFWKEILKHDSFCERLSENLLLNYFFILRIDPFYGSSSEVSREALNASRDLKSKVLDFIASMVTEMFYIKSQYFVIPTYWLLTSDSLKRILIQREAKLGASATKQFELIKARNEILMTNPYNESEELYQETKIGNLEVKSFQLRTLDDSLGIVDRLNRLILDEDLAKVILPEFMEFDWKSNLKLVVSWCISRERLHVDDVEPVLIICNFLKKRIWQKIEDETKRAEFEGEIMDLIYHLVDSQSQIDEYSLFVLINELYQLQVITISAYLRKLIASGIFYSTPGEGNQSGNMYFHLNIIKNLPMLNNRQCDNIIKKWSLESSDFLERFQENKMFLKEHLVVKFVGGSFIKWQFVAERLASLEVGMKFLLSNWIANELRKVIYESETGLIDISSDNVTVMYHFFTRCNNLTLFFKSWMILVLKNETGLVSLSIEALYLAASLMKHHYSLIKNMPGEYSELPSLSLQLVKLVMWNYQHHSDSNSMLLEFLPIWKFFENVVDETNPKDYENEERIQEVPILIKDQFDSPIKLPYNSKSMEYNLRDSRNDISTLIDANLEHLQTKMDLFGEIDTCSMFDNTTVILSLLYSISPQQSLKKLLFLKNMNENIFVEKLESSLLDLSLTENSNLIEILQLLVIGSVCSIQDLINIYHEVLPADALLEFSLGDLSTGSLDDTQKLLLLVAKSEFISEPAGSILGVVVGQMRNLKQVKFKQKLRNVLKHFAFGNPRGLTIYLINNLGIDGAISMFDDMLETNYQIRTPEEFLMHVSELNEFNYFIYLGILRCILSYPADRENWSQFEFFLSSILNEAVFRFKMSSSYFGELFCCLTRCHRRHVSQLLTLRVFGEIEFVWEDGLIRARSGNNALDLLPIYNDYFKKLMTNIGCDMSNESETFDCLAAFLTKMLEVVSLDPVDLDGSLEGVINTFIRISILNKSTLCSALARQNEVHYDFAGQLVSLLNSSFVCKSKKLRCVILDFISIIKSSLSRDYSVESDILGDFAVDSSRSIVSILEPPPSIIDEDNFKTYVPETSCLIELDDKELQCGGDIAEFNNSNLSLKSLHGSAYQRFRIRSFEVIEEFGSKLNDGCLNLLLLNAHTSKENPP